MGKIEVLGAAMLLLSACQKDTTLPVITQMTGPSDGSIINFDTFCFPVVVKDDDSDPSMLLLRTRFDSEWSEWSTNMVRCFDGVANGLHFFAAQAKDKDGNISERVTRRFFVFTR